MTQPHARMRESVAAVLLGLAIVGFALPQRGRGDEHGKPVAAPKTEAQAPQDTVAYLKAKGYVEIPLIRTKLGIFEVEAKINGQSMLFIVDCGAGNIVLDTETADKLKLPRQKTGHLNAGIGGAVALEVTPNQQVAVGPCEGRYNLSVSSLSFVNDELRKVGDKPCVGLLGFPFLKMNGAVIDYPSEKLLLMSPAAQLASVFDFSKATTRLNVSVNRTIENAQMSVSVTVAVLDQSSEAVNYSKYEKLQSGMTYAEVAVALGAGLDKCVLASGFSGTVRFNQGKNRINLTFQNGKVSGKSFEATE